ncbi:MAG: YigZ family protein [Duodenibacillus sp.]|nr:YigZ family protein [Duodenibacillus sp.]
MTDADSYTVPDLPAGAVHRAEEVIRGSRFIVHLAHADSPEAAKRFIDAIRAEHARATHNCWAFQAGRPASTARIGASDDGEPKGTAGRPMLNVLLHSGVGEVAAVVTRYFGGTLLGTGGLVRAYQGLVKLGLETLPVRVREPERLLEMTVRYSDVRYVEDILTRHGARIAQKRFESDAVLVVHVPLAVEKNVCARLNEATCGRVVMRSCALD